MTDEQPISRRAAREAAAAGGRRRPAKPAPPIAVPGDQPTELLGTGTAPEDAPRSGIAALVAKHPTAWLAGAIGVVFLLLGTGAVFAGVTVGSQAAPVPVTTETAAPRALPAGDLAASRLRTCSVAGAAADERLMSLYGQVSRYDTGEVLFDRSGDSPQRTASVLKILTAAAALQVLGPEYTIATNVYASPTPGGIVLVGRGDATLSQLPAGTESVYRGAPKLDGLAAQTLSAWPSGQQQITSIVLDATFWAAADRWDSSWSRSEQTEGYQSEVTALQVDGDREDPQAQDSYRSTDPIARAGQLFLAALRKADTQGKVADDVTFSSGQAVANQPQLAQVQSQPVSVLVDYMLKVSDNTLAEMLARVTSKVGSLDGSASSLQRSMTSVLTTLQVPTAGIVIRDGSGLSDLNAVPASVINLVVKKVIAREGNLTYVEAGLPVAGESGTLAGRFTGDNAIARGYVVAKTGWIDTSYSLGGYVTANDGTLLLFTFYAIGEGISSDARQALDTLATAVFVCGDNLSNN